MDDVIELPAQKRGLSDGGLALIMLGVVACIVAAVAHFGLSAPALGRGAGIAGGVAVAVGLAARLGGRTRLTLRRKDGRVLLWVGRVHEKGPFKLHPGMHVKGERKGQGHGLFLHVEKAGRDVCVLAEFVRGEAPSGYPPKKMPPRVPAFYVQGDRPLLPEIERFIREG